ncbi:cytochrome c biogenesis protein ResB [Streptomyces sp. TRM64462]|uniref:cytochrome c biogenesis protein ResB n=1 Tax=Streptomyces sp. TRM64462 TaxID=2741726 RepID=UPI0015866600|nr:cytochrome c biogenesis protein ResB [Streptomyces sp. TRM64462]
MSNTEQTEQTEQPEQREQAERAEQPEQAEQAEQRLSTAPRQDDDGTVTLPSLGFVGWIRWFWRQLTSMRVALILLFLLSLGAVPGSLIPQNGVDATKVEAFKKAHTTLAPIYEKLQLFDVYSSVWFSAVYILLFVSLIGCILPRTWQFTGQLRSRPPGAPKRLTRLPAYTTWRTTASPDEAREAALRLLRKHRFRTHTAGDAVAAEKGYLREAGNLLFHVALIVMLVAFAWGQLYRSEGGKLVVEGDGFSNTLIQYDDFRSGTMFSTHDLEPFSFELKQFTGTYETSGPQRGTPRTFEADVTYAEAGGPDKKAVIRVNEPLKVGDAKVYLIQHGYAPVVTVRDARGKVVFKEAVPLLPTDANVSSQGVIKVMDGYRNAKGEKEQLGFPAFFVPTFAGKGQGEMFSQFPGLVFPALNLSAYHGDLRVDSGVPQNVYQLDTSKMKPYEDANGEIFKKTLLPGETMTLPDGAGSITFEKEIKEWASFQISQQPGNGWALGGAVAALLGLVGSLFVQRRRIWVRAVEGADGVTVVEMAGLGRSESPKLPEELAGLAAALHSVAPSAPPRNDPEPDPDTEQAVPAVPAEGAEKCCASPGDDPRTPSSRSDGETSHEASQGATQ